MFWDEKSVNGPGTHEKGRAATKSTLGQCTDLGATCNWKMQPKRRGASTNIFDAVTTKSIDDQRCVVIVSS